MVLARLRALSFAELPVRRLKVSSIHFDFPRPSAQAGCFVVNEVMTEMVVNL